MGELNWMELSRDDGRRRSSASAFLLMYIQSDDLQLELGNTSVDAGNGVHTGLTKLERNGGLSVPEPRIRGLEVFNKGGYHAAKNLLARQWAGVILL
jgi:hypothetical protein